MKPIGRAPATAGSGLQFVVDQIGELLGIEQALIRAEQDLVGRTSPTEFRTNLERFIGEDRQHGENLIQALRMMLGAEAAAQAATDRGRQLAEATLQASQGGAFGTVRGLVLVTYQAALTGRLLMQVQQRIDSQEIVGLLETNHHQDEAHLHYLEGQLIHAAEELSGLPLGR